MKKYLLFGVFIILVQFVVAQDFEVEKAQVDIYINKEGFFDVEERYDLVFTQNKHGIYRNIQLVYDLENEHGEHEKRRIKISKIKIPNHKFSTESLLQKFSKDLEIKIGDPNKTVFGNQHYDIHYRVHNAFLFESDQTHFYWNIIPPGWRTTFKDLDFNIHIPEGVSIDREAVFVYFGSVGTSNESDLFEISIENGIIRGRSKPEFQSGFGESVTVLIKLPKDAVKEIVPIWPFWGDYGWTLILGFFVTIFYWIWNKFGKDDHVVATISYFPPEGIDSAMAGFLIDDSADSPDLISFIPAWGSKGIIRVEEIKKKGFFGKADTKLIRLKSLPEDVPAYERVIFNGLFSSGNDLASTIMQSAAGDFLKKNLNINLETADSRPGADEVLVSDLKNNFYINMQQAKKHLKDAAQTYYDPKAKKIMYWTIGGLILIGLGVAALFLFAWGILAMIGTIAVFGILLFFSQYLIKKNKKGNRLLSEIKGFKQFIKVAEANKLKMLIEEDPNYFEKTMAYALAFGLFSQWAKKFAALDISPPQWYSGTAGVMSMNSFSKSFSNTMQTAQRTMVSSPSGSGSGGGGGGSAGGGFGGGGGGSW